LLNDFADIKFSGNNFKSRLINNNHRLSDYENEMSQAQFLEQKYEVIVREYQNNNVDQIKEIIDNSSYNNQNILKVYFGNLNDLQASIGLLRGVIDDKYASLDKEFKKIEIASQNIISLNSQLPGINEDSIKNLKIEDLSDSTSLNNKRVMHLVS
jgi:aconitase B